MFVEICSIIDLLVYYEIQIMFWLITSIPWVELSGKLDIVTVTVDLYFCLAYFSNLVVLVLKTR